MSQTQTASSANVTGTDQSRPTLILRGENVDPTELLKDEAGVTRQTPFQKLDQEGVSLPSPQPRHTARVC